MDKPVIVKESTDSEGVDTDLMSRIIPILGAGNLKKLMGLKVLISGISGLGAEIAKNLILTGLGVVTIHDTEKVDWIDLSSHVRIALPHKLRKKGTCTRAYSLNYCFNELC